MRSMALASGVADFGQAKEAVLKIFDNIMHESIKTDLTRSYERDIGLQALETAARS